MKRDFSSLRDLFGIHKKKKAKKKKKVPSTRKE